MRSQTSLHHHLDQPTKEKKCHVKKKQSPKILKTKKKKNVTYNALKKELNRCNGIIGDGSREINCAITYHFIWITFRSQKLSNCIILICQVGLDEGISSTKTQYKSQKMTTYAFSSFNGGRINSLFKSRNTFASAIRRPSFKSMFLIGTLFNNWHKFNVVYKDNSGICAWN